jgi:hypothetical protein
MGTDVAHPAKINMKAVPATAIHDSFEKSFISILFSLIFGGISSHLDKDIS